MDLTELEQDPRLFLYTSLTAGSSHIITATSRLETILKANKIPFLAIDTATDEKARRLWGRRAGKRKLPGLVKEGYVVGDLEEVEEWNEFGELKESIGPVPQNNAASPAPPLPVNPTATAGTAKIMQSAGGINKALKPSVDESKMRPLPGAAEIAARNKAAALSALDGSGNAKPETMTSASDHKAHSIKLAKRQNLDEKDLEHLSAPASAIQSETVSPAPGPADAVAAGTKAASSQHRGNEDSEAPAEEIQKVEHETAIPQADEEGESALKNEAKDVKGDEVGEGKRIQGQNAKEPADAGKSVED